MLTRRQTMQVIAAALASTTLPVYSGELPLITRAIPSSGERLPVIGLGTSRTFDTAGDAKTINTLTDIMNAFFSNQGSIIDSSPMYGEAESRVGDVLRSMSQQPKIFAATKVWTTGKEQGIAQMEESARRMNVTRFDLIAVHNLKDWKTQLETLYQWKEEGKVRYIGITTSHGRNHAEFLEVMKTQAIDFAQFSYNIDDRSAEQQLLPMAQEQGIATMINRPYQRGSLFKKSKGEALPAMAADIDCDSWGQFYLKFIVSHPAVTCVIPATSKLHHMQDNMMANFGRLPTADQRTEMLKLFEAL
ncbi:MAG: aldo/keto reductase [Pseudomonadales bacterium]